jgi:hypothetical protein
MRHSPDGHLQLEETGQSRRERLAHKANEGHLSAEEAREYDRFIELGRHYCEIAIEGRAVLGRGTVEERT